MRAVHSILDGTVNALRKVSITHCREFKLGALADVYSANNILNGYARCQDFYLAHKMFDDMPHRDTVSWNTMIAGHVNYGSFEGAWEILNSMKRCGFDSDGYTFGSILKGVACACRCDLGQQVHSTIVKTGYVGNVYSGSALLDMYAKCGRVEEAYVVFKSLPERNSVSWNALIAGFVQVGDRKTAFWLLNFMEQEGVKLEDGTISPLLTLLDDVEFYKSVAQLHCKIIKHGLGCESTVCNATITSYSECGSIEDAERVFDAAFGNRDLVTWNSMLAAYLVHNNELVASKLFIDMQMHGFEPDIYSYTSIISAYSEVNKNHGNFYHGLVIKRGLEKSEPISNALIARYLKSNKNSMEEALRIFESMESKDRVSWNSILTGFSQIGLNEDALKLFGHMRFLEVEIDHYALSAVLRSCSDLATLQLGQQFHALTHKSGFQSNEFVASSLIFMYTKCGIIEDARKSFEETPRDRTITWNSIIFGYAQHGQGYVALDLFFQMKKEKVKLDHITFIAVLTACSHMGLVEQGSKFLKSMESNYGITPRMEHYACAVDLYGRAGRLDEAKVLIEAMPFKPDAMVLKTLLGACRACGNIELAAQIAGHLLDLEPEEHCTYVLLSDMYGHLKRWDEKASVKRLMRERGVRKVPGWSWIEVKNEVFSFKAEDRSHPHCEEIYFVLGVLMEEIRRMDVAANLNVLMHDFDHIDGYFDDIHLQNHDSVLLAA
ncbi:putative pentatricopeptide repeat-containing protein At3g25970 [Pyrus x bretschneideri]|uniref:putative pentatricopeptide repeat-containing protein At3g25970 n=1 Tax=Pyrus x bretschneideri TaxID=225117 RepID=UPI00202E3A7C|nr:putative pentatricopeptide repeat-containing protein At3g25970 [Pyrus x bretschneideri]